MSEINGTHRPDAPIGLSRREWLAGAVAGVGTITAPGVRTAFAQGTPKRGGTLRVATVDKPVNMDPGYAQLYSSLQIYQNVYNKLSTSRGSSSPVWPSPGSRRTTRPGCSTSSTTPSSTTASR